MFNPDIKTVSTRKSHCIENGKIIIFGPMLVSKQQLFIFFLGMLLVSLAISPFFLSVSMIALGVLALVDIALYRKGLHLDFYREGYRRLRNFTSYPEFICLTGIFFIVFLGIFQNEDAGYYMTRLRIKAPFLLFPLAFISLPRITEKQLSGIFAFFLLFITLLAVGVLINYLYHLDAINQALLRGSPMPTPGNHIRFSLLIVIGVLGSIWLWLKRYRYRYRFEPILYLICGVSLIIFLHVLSVRSGLLALYLMLFVLGVRSLFSSGYKRKVAPYLFVLLLLPFLAYVLVPSLRAKIQYTFYDVRMFVEGKGGAYADSGRLASMDAGMEVARENILFGVGAGNLKKAMQEKMQEKYPEYKDTLMPHSQFITVLAGTGILGFGIFLFAVFYPFIHNKNYRHWLILGFYIVSMTLFLIESTLENAAGVAFFLFFLLIFLSTHSKKEAGAREGWKPKEEPNLIIKF